MLDEQLDATLYSVIFFCLFEVNLYVIAHEKKINLQKKKNR